MSEVKFTKGEWVTDGDWVTCEGNAVCMMGDSWVNYDNFRENAHLIAASPAMYKEIEDDIKWLERLAKKYVIGSYELQGVLSRIQRKRELLAKARGE